MSWMTRHPGLVRARPPEAIAPFATLITAGSLAEIRHDCLCTWVPRHGRFHLKFANHDCPVLAHTR